MELPLKGIIFKNGEIEVKEEEEGYTIKFSSNAIKDDGDLWIVEKEWTLVPKTHEYKTGYNTFKNGALYKEWKKPSKIGEAERDLYAMGFHQVVQSIQNPNAEEDSGDRDEPKAKKKEDKKDEIPVDTILENLPHGSVTQALEFSSMDKLREQLDEWGIPYQFVTFTKGKRRVQSTTEAYEESPEIIIWVENSNRTISKRSIVDKIKEKYDTPLHYKINQPLTSDNEGRVIVRTISAFASATRTTDEKVLKPDQPEVTLPTKYVYKGRIEGTMWAGIKSGDKSYEIPEGIQIALIKAGQQGPMKFADPNGKFSEGELVLTLILPEGSNDFEVSSVEWTPYVPPVFGGIQ